MATQTYSKVRETAGQNAQLLQTLSETDYASTALQQSNAYIANLKNEILSQEKKLKEAQNTVAREHKEHRQYADSHVKRLAYKFGGKREKFEQQASKEEKDWVDAIQREIEASKKLDTLKRNLAEAGSTSAELQKVVDTHSQAQQGLDQLYRAVFDGPTPEIPGEDLREDSAKHALSFYEEVQTLVNKEKQVCHILSEANRFVKMALMDVEDARSTAKADAYGFGGSFMEMHEHSAVSRVRQHMGQVEMLLSNARLIQPLVGEIGNVFHAKNDVLMDVVFDNIFSDLDKYDQIKQSQASIQKAQANLKTINEAAEARLASANAEASRAKQVVDAKRAELQEFRANVYFTAQNGGANTTGNERPPQWTATDTATHSTPPPSYKEGM